MNIKLERKIEIRKYKVILDIGQKEERSDVIALLLIAQSNNNRLTKDIVCNKFLFRDHDKMAENVLRRCIDYEVLDTDYKITEKGLQAIEDGMIYHYYNGVFYLYATNDPLIPQKILDIELCNENINFRDEIREPGETTELIDIPLWMKDIENIKDKKLFNTDKIEIDVKSISDKIELIENYDQLVTINITSKSCILKMEGLYDDQREINYFPNYNTVLHLLFEERINDWDWNDNKLKVVSAILSDSEKINFKRKISFKNPKIPDFGDFNSVSFIVNIKPKTEFDANKWANWLLKNEINDFMFEPFFVKRKQEIAKLFQNYKIEFHSHEFLCEEMKNSIDFDNISNKYWFVVSPSDLLPINEKENS